MDVLEIHSPVKLEYMALRITLFHKHEHSPQETGGTGSTARKETRAHAVPPIAASLDAFRGLTILILLVAHHLSFRTPEILTNADFGEGIHLVDFIFPWFLLAAGIAVAGGGTPHYSERKKWSFHILRAGKSALVMFVLGCIVDSTMAGRVVIGFGILQYIGLASLVTGILYDLGFKRRALIAAALLIGYWAFIKLFPLAGIGRGIFTADINAITQLDRMYLESINLDGILQLFPAVAMTLIGSVLCDYLRTRGMKQRSKLRNIIVAGVLGVFFGYLWNLDIPFSKPYLTPSYILFTAGLGSIIVSIIYGMVCTRKAQPVMFFISVLGLNALAAYVLPILFRVLLMQGISIDTTAGMLNLKDALILSLQNYGGFIAGSAFYTLALVGLWWFILLPLYRKRIILKP